MEKRNRLSMKSSASGLGLQFLAVVYLLMDKIQPPGWVWGTVGTLCALLVVINLIDLWTAKTFSITEDGKLVRE